MKPVEANMKIKVLPEGIQIQKPGRNDTLTYIEKYPGYVFQCNEEVHYEQDFYKLAWANINEPLTVMVMVHCHKKGTPE